MEESSTHLFVPIPPDEREICLGADGSVAHVIRVIRLIQGRWKLPILFRLYADPSMRTLTLKRDLQGISQKILTEQLRQLASDGLIERIDFGELPRRVEYQLSELGRQLLPVLLAMRRYAVSHLASND